MQAAAGGVGVHPWDLAGTAGCWGWRSSRRDPAALTPARCPAHPGPQGSLTTHVLNTATGLPAARLALRLAQLQEPGAQWRELAQRWTDEDGRCLPLLPPGQAKAGTYKLHFETAAYWESLGYSSFYPFVEVVFTITDPTQKLHVPLLISPYSYTTYRGS
uniref:5-hydroxyisourate hydrolase n=1 Tax=Anas platyrhynchos platyrhynchos TaxID=8840 RepID=A0A493T6U0_ANAPP